jgi:hypothetical protein
MADYHALTALALTLLNPVMADELPNEMLLQCEGKMNAVRMRQNRKRVTAPSASIFACGME